MTKVNGIILIDKPKGKTSPQVTQEISKIFKTKAGHCGALDPFATGILPITLGKAVKIQEYIQRMDKEYEVQVKTRKEVPQEKLEEVLKQFKGKVIQKPPEKSAVKREERPREIYSITKIESKGKTHTFNVFCQHGTYIRVLVDDLEKKLSIGTTLKELRRTNLGPWNIKETMKIEEVLKKKKEDAILPIEDALIQMPKIEVKSTAVKSISHGEDLKAPGIKSTKGEITIGSTIVLEKENKVLAIGKALASKEEMVKREKGVVVKTEKVIISNT